MGTPTPAARATACEYHDEAGACTEECVAMVDLMMSDGGGETMIYGDYLGGESTTDRSGCHAPEPRTYEVARLDTERRAVVLVEVCPEEDRHDAMPCHVCSFLGE